MIPRTSIHWYGAYAQGKTLLIGQLAKWVHATTNGEQHTRMYSRDGGGDAPVIDTARAICQVGGQTPQGQTLWVKREVDPKGCLEVLHMGDAPFRFEFLDQVTRGWWPDASGIMKPPTPEILSKVGARVNEGLTSYCEAMLDTLSEKIEGGQIKVDPNATSKFERPGAMFKDGSSTIADVPPGLFKLIYQRIHKYVNQSHGLPGISCWTAKELQVEDKDTKVKSFGPLLVGTKETSQAPGWFEHTLHLTTANTAKLVETTNAAGQKVKKQVAHVAYRIHLKPYYDSDMPTVPYLCGLRLAASTSRDDVPAFIEDQSEDGRPWSKANPFDMIMPLIGLGGGK